MAQYSENRAPVSGPGPFSQRSDRGSGQPIRSLPNAAYGEGKDFKQIQQGAAMAQAQPAPKVTPMGAPTQQPDVPVTDGANVGAGRGMDALGIPTPADNQLADYGKLAQYLPMMEMYANTPGSTGTMKAFVKYLRSQTR